jgi:nitrite reductase/ring-hydroxylating ferredoxin subunit
LEPWLCRVDDIPDGGVLGLDPPDPQGFPLLLMRDRDQVHGWLNVCPQDGRRMDVAPGRFRVEGGELRCAIRGAVFALRDGARCVSGPCRGRSLASVPLRVERGVVLRGPRSAVPR